jgi:hypothetical protein
MITKVIVSLSVLLMTVSAWEFDVYNSLGCNQGLLTDHSGTEDMACTELTNAARAKFILYDMGECSIELYSGTDDKCPESNFQQIYDEFDEKSCITPDYNWNYFLVTAC